MQFSHFSSSFDIEFSVLSIDFFSGRENLVKSEQDHFFQGDFLSQKSAVRPTVSCSVFSQSSLGKYSKGLLFMYMFCVYNCRNRSEVESSIRIRCPNAMLVAVAFPFRKLRPSAFWGHVLTWRRAHPQGCA